MMIGERLRLLREQKGLSQTDIERRTGLLRNYISRVENNQTIPSVGTLQKMAQGLGVPLYWLLYERPQPTELPKRTLANQASGRDGWGISGEDARFLTKLRRCLSRMTPPDRSLLMAVVSLRSKQNAHRDLKSH
jgi:transcriptional regulator with XRE-family HTH domain